MLLNIMKRTATLWLLCLTLVWVACGEEAGGDQADSSTEGASAETGENSREAEMATSATADVGICLWNEAGLRTAPGRSKDAKWVTSISFGEVVTLTGEETTIEGEDRTYLQMELSDGKSGWSYGYLFATDALRAAALQDIELYKRPDLTTFGGKKFERGEIFAVLAGGKDDWVEVVGKERQRTGWVRKSGASYSTDEIDVTIAILIDRALEESDPRKREEALSSIAENSTFSGSAMLSLVDDKLSSIPIIPDLPANQLYITAQNLNARSEADSEADNVVFQLNEGDICTILERGELASIRNMEDYWYRVSFQGQNGWVFGYFTSKRLAE
jgi:uncharacterized protein YgiM (DUF1202 family)